MASASRLLTEGLPITAFVAKRFQYCHGCGTIDSGSGTFLACSRCQDQLFCSRACQVTAWEDRYVRAHCRRTSRAQRFIREDLGPAMGSTGSTGNPAAAADVRGLTAVVVTSPSEVDDDGVPLAAGPDTGFVWYDHDGVNSEPIVIDVAALAARTPQLRAFKATGSIWDSFNPAPGSWPHLREIDIHGTSMGRCGTWDFALSDLRFFRAQHVEAASGLWLSLSRSPRLVDVFCYKVTDDAAVGFDGGGDLAVLDLPRCASLVLKRASVPTDSTMTIFAPNATFIDADGNYFLEDFVLAGQPPREDIPTYRCSHCGDDTGPEPVRCVRRDNACAARFCSVPCAEAEAQEDSLHALACGDRTLELSVRNSNIQSGRRIKDRFPRVKKVHVTVD